MKSKAVLKLEEGTFKIISCTFSLYLDTEVSGKPSEKNARGGVLDLTMIPAKNSKLFEWICNPVKKESASIIFYKSKNKIVRELKLTDVYIITYNDGFDINSPDSMYQYIGLSARIIEMGNGKYDSGWDKP